MQSTELFPAVEDHAVRRILYNSDVENHVTN